MEFYFTHQQRKCMGEGLQESTVAEDDFHNLRHWKATTQYYRTRDILHVRQLFSHKSLTSTMVYIDIEKALFGEPENAEFISRVARSLRGARALIEAGFDYVTDMDGYKVFRKRK